MSRAIIAVVVVVAVVGVSTVAIPFAIVVA